MAQYIVVVERTLTYEVTVEANSEDKAEKLGKKAVLNEEYDPVEDELEATDVYESQDESSF